MSDPLAADPTLLDKLAIREVLERYMRFNDDRAADRIAELFDENAIFQVVGRLVVGRDAIREFFGGADEQPKPWTERGELLKQPPSVHLSANPVIDVDGDTATSELDFLVVGRGEDTSRVGVSVARPGDARTDNEWQQVFARLTEDERARFLT
jgi:hypothetical protein